MAILPLQLARVSNLLRTSVSQQAMASTQQQLLEVQNELSTGKRLNSPSDDPGASATAMQLRKVLEQRQAYATNITNGQNQLGEVDSTLSDLTDLLRQAQTIASANVGSDVTADQRTGAAAVVQNLFSQSLSLGNKQYDGVYIFAGDRSTAAPFVESSGGGVKFVGDANVLQNQVDESTMASFRVDGNEVFGALSDRVAGTVDLAPKMTVDTRLTDLGGAQGQGIRLGSIQISNGAASTVVDLTGCNSVQDVINKINAAVPGVGASLGADGKSLKLAGGAGQTLAVNEVGGGTAAADLGILQPTAGADGAAVNGADLAPKVTALTNIDDLRGGAGIDRAGGLKITNGQTTATITLPASVKTVEDLLNAINGSAAGVTAKINAAGNGIDIVNPIQNSPMSISENGGTTAADLGVRSFGPQTSLGDLNNGNGVKTVAGGDFQITRQNGTKFSVDLSAAKTIQDVIDTINTAGGPGTQASFSTSSNGIVIKDMTGGAGQLVVTPLNNSDAAKDLGLTGGASGNTLVGADINPVETNGIFGNLARLQKALASNDQAGITAAAGDLQNDLGRVIRIRGRVGAQVQGLNTRQQNLEDENTATKSLLSSLEDTDFTSAVSKFQTLQTTLQANYQTAGKTLNLSLLDFLQ